jgi:chromosome segregation ATPase
MGRKEATKAIYSEEIEEVHMDERVGKLQSDVEHVRASITRIDGDVHEIRGDLKVLAGKVAELTIGQEKLRTEMANLRGEFKADIADLRAEVKAEIADLRNALDKLKASQRIGFLLIILGQVVATGATQFAMQALKVL